MLFDRGRVVSVAGVGAYYTEEGFIKWTKGCIVVVTCAYGHRCLLTGLSESC